LQPLLPAKLKSKILTRLTALSAEHFNCSPDTVARSDAGALGNYFERLGQISDAAFHKGEHAA